jgi:hypothetical protein
MTRQGMSCCVSTCARGRLTSAGRAQGVLERVARHSKRVATGVLHVAHAWPTKVADALVARLGGRATLVQDELAPGQPLATRRGAAKEIACASVLAVVDVCVPRPRPRSAHCDERWRHRGPMRCCLSLGRQQWRRSMLSIVAIIIDCNN